MNILVIGSGGREHALCWAIAKSERCQQLYCAPGNAGIAAVADCVELDAADHAAVIAFCREKQIDLVVVGPEVPLVAGIADDLRAVGITTFGPGRDAARLEGSKGFTKDVCARFGIPTAAYGRFCDAQAALDYLEAHPAPIVIKADGLAAGKGVIIASTDEEAVAAVRDIFGGRFGAAGTEVVIEEFLEGEEASFFALCDGRDALALGTAQDHKRVGEGDVGPNTGGMGAYSPAPIMDAAMSSSVMEEIIMPTVNGLAEMACPYQGILFAGLMITSEGPKLIEYNCRFGDPECQVLMMRLQNDLIDLIFATCEGRLGGQMPVWSNDAALTVVMAAPGYPGKVETGSRIGALDMAAAPDGVEIFHAGTRREGDDVVASGGRVLNVTALGGTVSEAATRAYKAIAQIDWPEGFYRRDIGWRAIDRERRTVS